MSVFCSLDDGTTSGPFEQVTLDDSLTVSKALNRHEFYTCYWFLISANQTLIGAEFADVASPTDGDSTGDAEFDASLYTCAQAPEGDTLDAFWNTCDPLEEPRNVQLRPQSGGDAIDQNTGDLSPAAVTFDGIAADDWNAVTEVATGFAESVVFCATFDGTDQAPYSQIEVEQPAGFNFTLKDGEALTCEWFFVNDSSLAPGATTDPGTTDDVPGSTHGTPGNQTVTIVLKNCPVLYRDENWGRDCVDPIGNIRFALIAPGNNSETDIRTDANGMVTFVVPYTGKDSLVIEEAAPETVGRMVILGCEQDGQAFDTPFVPAFEVTVAGNITIAVPSGSEITCTWLNIPSTASYTLPILAFGHNHILDVATESPRN